jgi:DegV family protein with EDD domain
MGKSISSNSFFKMIEEGAEPVTSQINSERYINFWEPFLEKGQEVLHICLSSGLSGSYNSAMLAKNYLEEKYPNAKLHVVDSLGASSGSGLLVSQLIDMRNDEKDVKECFEWAENNKLNIHHWFIFTDLTSFRRGGRISSTSFFLGQLLKICPLMNMDYNGKLIPRKKIRTKDKAINELINMMEINANDGLNYQGKCCICHSARLEDAKKVKTLVENKFVYLKDKVEIYDIGTVIGSHTGPGTVALFFVGNKRID